MATQGNVTFARQELLMQASRWWWRGRMPIMHLMSSYRDLI